MKRARGTETIGSLLAMSLLAIPMAPLHAAQARRVLFGTMPDGHNVDAVTLTNGKGMQVRILAWGALIQQLSVPDRKGHSDDIVLGFDDLAPYLAKNPYFGASIGRYANRIGAGRFTLDGKAYQISINDGAQSLHGGVTGFDHHLWAIESVTSGPQASVTLAYTSPDGEEGYPGTLTAHVTYTLNEANELSAVYSATTDMPTIVNLTNHSYFNLSGARSGHSILNDVLTLPASRYTPTDAGLIPTGELRDVKGTVFDFRKPKRIGARIFHGAEPQLVLAHGYDHNWVVDRKPGSGLVLGARVADPASGRVMEVWSDQPGMQFYSGNFLDATVIGKGGVIYRQAAALALEPQLFPDTPNHPAFGSARLNPGQTYHHHIRYRFLTTPARQGLGGAP